LGIEGETVTTIAYRDGVMAADSLIGSGDLIEGIARKIERLQDGSLFGFTGDYAMFDAVLDWLNSGGIFGDRPKDERGNFEAVIVRPDGALIIVEKSFRTLRMDAEYYAAGSGH
jgi:hypothetical protein